MMCMDIGTQWEDVGSLAGIARLQNMIDLQVAMQALSKQAIAIINELQFKEQSM